MKEGMSNPEYKASQDRLIDAAAMILPLDLERMLQKIKHTESLRNVLDPETYKRGAPTLARVKRLVIAARAFHKETRKLADELENKN